MFKMFLNGPKIACKTIEGTTSKFFCICIFFGDLSMHLQIYIGYCQIWHIFKKKTFFRGDLSMSRSWLYVFNKNGYMIFGMWYMGMSHFLNFVVSNALDMTYPLHLNIFVCIQYLGNRKIDG